MAIKIIPEQDIYLTQSEHDRLRQEYAKCCMFMAYPPSFETWIKQRQSTNYTKQRGEHE